MEAFLICIRNQFQEFIKGVASKMVIIDEYFTITDEASVMEDTQAHHAQDNFTMPAQNSASTCRALTRPRFHLHH